MAKKPPWWFQTARARRYARISRQFAHAKLEYRAEAKFLHTEGLGVSPPPLHVWSLVANGVHIKSEALMEDHNG